MTYVCHFPQQTVNSVLISKAVYQIPEAENSHQLIRRTIMEIITIYLFLSGRFIGVLLFRCLVVATDGVTGFPVTASTAGRLPGLSGPCDLPWTFTVSVRLFFYLSKWWRGCGVKVHSCVVNLCAKWTEPLIALLECWYQSWLICRNYFFFYKLLFLKKFKIKYILLKLTRKFIN